MYSSSNYLNIESYHFQEVLENVYLKAFFHIKIVFVIISQPYSEVEIVKSVKKVAVSFYSDHLKTGHLNTGFIRKQDIFRYSGDLNTGLVYLLIYSYLIVLILTYPDSKIKIFDCCSTFICNTE